MLYLTSFVGTGTLHDPFRPPLLSPGINYIDLRRDSSQVEGYGLIWISGGERHSSLTKIAEDKDESLTKTASAAITKQLRIATTARNPKELILDALMHPALCRRPLRGDRNGWVNIGFSGQSWIHQRLIRGGATDDFNRADSSTLGANWTKMDSPFGDCTIVSNTAFGPAAVGTYCIDRYTGGTFGDDQYSQAVVSDAMNNGEVGVLVRGTNNDCYVFLCSMNSNNLYIYKLIDGSFTLLESGGNDDLAVSDVIKVTVEGTAIKPYINTVLQMTGTTTDSAIGSGVPGIILSGDQSLDDWEGDTIMGGGGGGACAPTLGLLGVGRTCPAIFILPGLEWLRKRKNKVRGNA